MNLHHSTANMQRKTASHEPKLRTTIDGQEKLCTRCREWWPADLEFFYPSKEGAAGLFYCCKACYSEWKVANAAKKAERAAA